MPIKKDELCGDFIATYYFEFLRAEGLTPMREGVGRLPELALMRLVSPLVHKISTRSLFLVIESIVAELEKEVDASRLKATHQISGIVSPIVSPPSSSFLGYSGSSEKASRLLGKMSGLIEYSMVDIPSFWKPFFEEVLAEYNSL